jgi:ribonuclease HI
MKLSENQQEAFALIKEFLSAPVPVFILKGYAGTGKTYLIKAVAEYLESRKRSFYLCAPTGRAARVLANSTGLDAQTIHRTIYKKNPSELHSDDRLIFNFEVYQNDYSERVYIIDEASMISDNEDKQIHLRFGSGKLLYDLLQYSKLAGEGDGNNKIIFVGDDAQLPPVNSAFSPALSADYLSDTYGLASREYILTDVFRQKQESGIIKEATKLRDAVIKNEYNCISFGSSNDVIPFSPENKYERIANEIKEGNAILISYTNAAVNEFNKLVRGKYNNSNTEEIQPGDRVIVNVNNQLYNRSNGDIGRVVEVRPPLKEVINSKRLEEAVTLTYRPVEIEFEGERGVYIILENLLYSETGDLTPDESRAMYILAHRKCGRKPPNDELKISDPKKYYSLRKEYIKAMEESSYLSALQVKYAYAITCHKAQGGEWDSVFVDFSGHGSYNNVNFFRWAYTAITRASRKLYLLNTVEGSPWAKSMLKEFKPVTEHIFETSPDDPIVIYTDGSDIKGTGMIGYGVYFNYHGTVHKISGVEDINKFKIKYNLDSNVSNPTMEVKAVADCLKEFHGKNVNLVIKSDYLGVQKWIMGLWKINKDYIRDLVIEAREHIKSIEHAGGSVKLKWVKGHQIIKAGETAAQKRDRLGNEAADEVAKDRFVYNTLKGINPPEPFSLSRGADSTEEPEPAKEAAKSVYTESLPNDYCIEIDKKIKEVLSKTEYNIVKTEALQYRQRYSLKGDEDNILIVDFVYNKRGAVRPEVFKRNNVYSENEILRKLLKVGDINTPVKEAAGKEFPKQFLKDYYEELKRIFLPDGIEITGVQHLNYLERYRFKKGSSSAQIDVYYNGKNLITKKMLSPGRAGEAALSNYILQKIPVSDGKH